jgi:alcohol oxidase
VSPEGKRQDAAHVYIHPLIQSGHRNLHLLLETEVIRVIFNGDKAVGVECRPNPVHQPEIAASEPKIIRAKKLVVLSAGALSSPQILEQSGVGDARLLEKLDIPVIADLPGVGENYNDHNHIMYAYKTSLDASETFDGKPTGDGDPKMGWNGIGKALCTVSP